jgi:hypothetical protein
MSVNLKRRHLSATQQSMVAAAIVTMTHGGLRTRSPNGDRPAQISQRRAADLLNVGKRSVEGAAEILESAVPELAEWVKRGEVTVSATVEKAKLPEPEAEDHNCG